MKYMCLVYSALHEKRHWIHSPGLFVKDDYFTKQRKNSRLIISSMCLSLEVYVSLCWS